MDFVFIYIWLGLGAHNDIGNVACTASILNRGSCVCGMVFGLSAVRASRLIFGNYV